MVYNALTAHAGLLVPTLIIGFLTEKNLFAQFFLHYPALLSNRLQQLQQAKVLFLPYPLINETDIEE